MRPAAVIADDEPMLRAQLRAALADAWPDLEVVAEAANGTEAVNAVRELRPAFAFLDIEMPGMNGLEAAQAIGDQTHVVFVTAYDRYAVDAFERGATRCWASSRAASRPPPRTCNGSRHRWATRSGSSTSMTCRISSPTPNTPASRRVKASRW